LLVYFWEFYSPHSLSKFQFEKLTSTYLLKAFSSEED